MRRKLNFINVVRVYVDALDFTISEIRRQHHEVRLEKFALLLSFHPTGTPAKKHASLLIEAFRRVKEALADTPSIKLGVLIQSTLGHGWSGPVPLTGEKWQRIVMDDGSISSRMCPTDAAFRHYVLECVEGIMQVGPAFLLLDDDFGLRKGECFCPNHLAMFNRETGVERTAQEVVALLKEKPADDRDVQIFSRQRGELLVAFAREIREVIDRYDSGIVCTMCTPWGGHGFVNEVTHALAGKGGVPSARVNNAIYGSNNPIGLLQLTTSTERIVNVFENVPDLIDEADTFPQTYYSENATLFNAHLVNAVLNGLTGAKLWMFEFELPRSIGSQARFEEIFKRNHPLYEELFNTVNGIQWLGMKSVLSKPKGMLHPFNVSQKLYVPDWHTSVCGMFALPICYGRVGEEGLFALNGDLAEQLSDDDITTLFSQSLLLDSKAVKVLDKRGFAELMGVTTGNNPTFFFQSEYMDGMPAPASLMWDASAAELQCISSETQVASWCMVQNMETGSMEKVSPCMTFFHNRLGGRVAALAWSSDMPYYKVLKNERRRILLTAIDFLNGGLLEMTVESKHQAIVRHGRLLDGTELLAIISLALDSESAISLRCATSPHSILRLQENGTWQPVSFQHTENLLTVNTPLTLCTPVLLHIVR